MQLPSHLLIGLFLLKLALSLCLRHRAQSLLGTLAGLLRMLGTLLLCLLRLLGTALLRL